jgi:hypothetical protein
LLLGSALRDRTLRLRTPPCFLARSEKDKGLSGDEPAARTRCAARLQPFPVELNRT